MKKLNSDDYTRRVLEALGITLNEVGIQKLTVTLELHKPVMIEINGMAQVQEEQAGTWGQNDSRRAGFIK